MSVSHRAIDVSLVLLTAFSCFAASLVVGPAAGWAQDGPEIPQKAPEAPEEPSKPNTEVPVEAPGGGAAGVPIRNHRDITTDAKLAEVLGQVFGEVDRFQGIEVSVADGVVHLEGTAQSASARAAAEELAARFAHTLYVDNQIQVDDTPASSVDAPAERSIQDEVLQERLATIFSRVDELDEVRVEVQAGVVHLTGRTVSPDAVVQAETLAGQLEGVAYVDNDIEVLREIGERLSPALQTARDKIVEFVQYLPLFAVALLILGLFGGLASLASRFDLPGERFERQPFLQNLVQQVIAVVVFSVGVVFVLELFQVTTLVGAVLGTAGVAGLAFGLAFRDIGENYLAGLWLGLQQPFEKNELVEIGEYHGKVIRLTTRATVLMTLGGPGPVRRGGSAELLTLSTPFILL
jgi:osmotically-inducible protein OsmY